jgi:phosphate transport system substrate-binding protein
MTRHRHELVDRLLRWPVLAALLFSCLIFASLAEAQEMSLKVGGSGVTLGTMRLLGQAFEKLNPGVRVVVLSSLGSTGGIKAVLSNAIDIGVSARPLKQAEIDRGAVAAEYGRSPLVFAVSKTAKVTEITTAQLIDIYTGRLKEWPSGIPIRLILRPASDINSILLKALSPQMKDAVSAAEKRPGMLFALTDQETIERLESIPGSIGPTSLNELVIEAPNLKALKLNGIAPSAATMANGLYPLHYRFFLVTCKSPSAIAKRFIAFAQSDPGRMILTETGHSLSTPLLSR